MHREQRLQFGWFTTGGARDLFGGPDVVELEVRCGKHAPGILRQRIERQRHAVRPEPPRRVDRDHADQPAIALAAVDEAGPVVGRLQELEARRSRG